MYQWTAARRGAWSAEKRAAMVAMYEARIRAREASDPLHCFRVLRQWADPDVVRAIPTLRLESGKAKGISDHHEMLRRCFVLRAWCAWRMRWHDEAKEALREAGEQRRLARAARREGR